MKWWIIWRTCSPRSHSPSKVSLICQVLRQPRGNPWNQQRYTRHLTSANKRTPYPIRLSYCHHGRQTERVLPRFTQKGFSLLSALCSIPGTISRHTLLWQRVTPWRKNMAASLQAAATLMQPTKLAAPGKSGLQLRSSQSMSRAFGVEPAGARVSCSLQGDLKDLAHKCVEATKIAGFALATSALVVSVRSFALLSPLASPVWLMNLLGTCYRVPLR